MPLHPGAAEDGAVTAAITWLGHSTTLMELSGARVLTDPLLRSRLAHLTRRSPAVDPGFLENLDAVVISHVHRDHLDLPSLRRLARRGPLVVPAGSAGLLSGFDDVRELTTADTLTVGGVRITATAAVHHARRGLRGPRVPALGYVVEGAARIYFAGDTELFHEMASLVPLDAALLPVWGWGTSLGPGHLDPRSAAEALSLLRPRVAVPIHWGTYFPIHLGRSGHRLLEDPPHQFARHAAELAPEVEVRVLQPGARLELETRRARGAV
jgi:L-ascorbate metabolism protein UlaG (beta-lactamase superfamily)